MKGIGEVLGLPLIAVEEGVECGNVKEVLINPENGRVEYLIIDDGHWYLGAKLLRFDDVIGMGSHAVTTNTRSNIKGFGEVEEAVELAGKNVRILGARCYTQKGKYIGVVKEYYINEEDGMIKGCEIDTHEIPNIIPASSVLTFGKDVLVVIENVEETLLNSFKDEDCSEHKHDVKSTSTTKLFEQRQIQFLLGRKASKRIVDDKGGVLVDKDQVVTEEIVDRIRGCGKLVELTMNIR